MIKPDAQTMLDNREDIADRSLPQPEPFSQFGGMRLAKDGNIAFVDAAFRRVVAPPLNSEDVFEFDISVLPLTAL